MNDRELLEAAAKAAGLESYSNELGRGPIYRKYHQGLQDWVRWNPLTDDGDALRLAVTLRIDVWYPGNGAVQARYMGAWIQTEVFYEDTDECAATRLAIVRAAAEIGKGMK